MFKYERNDKLYKELCAKYPQCPKVWEYFLSLTEVPRPSHHTELATQWAIAKGKELGGEVKSDALGNVSIKFPATAGKEKLPAVVLQAHLDMVPTKTPDQVHDFEKDPIVARLTGDCLRATNTTLGGDDGSGVAAALAVACDKNIVRGPLELLFTVNEEVGLLGANGLTEGELLSENAKYMINVDSEDWGEICLSCAGGTHRVIHVPVERAPVEAGWEVYNFELNFFFFVKSCCEIYTGRANALKWAVEILANNTEAIAGCPYRLVQLHAGNAHNAIPSHAAVEIALPADRAEKFIVAARAAFSLLSLRYAAVEKTATKEPNVIVTKLEKATAEKALTFSSSRTALRCLEAVHHGIFAWSEEVPDLVETSQSLSVAAIDADACEMTAEVYARSAKNERLHTLAKLCEVIAELYGGKAVPKTEDTPGWPADPHSTVCKASVAVYKNLFKEDPKLTSIHAGLECGVIMDKFPKNGMEAISVGPTVKHPHTPDEFIEMPTWVKLYEFLAGVVAELAK